MGFLERPLQKALFTGSLLTSIALGVACGTTATPTPTSAPVLTSRPTAAVQLQRPDVQATPANTLIPTATPHPIPTATVQLERPQPTVTVTPVIPTPTSTPTSSILDLIKKDTTKGALESVIDISVKRRDIDASLVGTFISNVLSNKDPADNFYLYFLNVQDDNASVSIYLAEYAGLRRSDLINDSVKLLNNFRQNAKDKLNYVTSIQVYQGAERDKQEAVAVIEVIVPLTIFQPERGLYAITRERLSRIPIMKISSFEYPAVTGFYIKPATNIAYSEGLQGTAYPIESVFPRFTTFAGLAREGGGAFDAFSFWNVQNRQTAIDLSSAQIAPDRIAEKIFGRTYWPVGDPVRFYAGIIWSK